MSDRSFVHRLLLAVGVLAAAGAAGALVVIHAEVVLVAFAGVLGAVFLDALARPLLRVGLPRWAAVTGVTLLLLGVAALALLLAGARIGDETAQLLRRLPQLPDQAWRALSRSGLGNEALQVAAQASENGAAPSWKQIAPYVFGSVAGVFGTAAGAAGGAVTVAALAVFFAIQPEVYLGGALLLVSRERRGRIREVAEAAGRALRSWLVGRAIAMAIVAALTTIGLALLGVRLALVLGVAAGILTFVPYVGPILAAVPAVLVTAAQGSLLLWVAALYVGVQLAEDYLVTPLVEGRAVSLPPALLVLAQILMGVWLGLLGLVLATPLLVAAVVVVQGLYVQDVLGEPVTLLGDRARGGAPARARARRLAAERAD